MRFNRSVESSAALASGTTFANVVGGSTAGFKIRRVQLGVRTSSAVVPTSQQVTVGISRATARGTQTTNNAGLPMDGNWSAASNITGVDSAWSINPTVSSNYNYEPTFNTQSGADLPFELLEELVSAPGTANGIAFTNVGLALPASHFIVLGVEWEE